MTIIIWLRWLFSNSGALGRGKETLDSNASMTFAAAKRPLMKRKCNFCGGTYWAFTNSNEYCGRFKCYRRLYASK